MTLIVEDGSIVANANSYIDLDEARVFALTRGITLSAVDATLESQIILAMDYLESKRDEYQGIKTNETQSLQWPRYDVFIDSYLISSNVIPKTLKDAQCQLVIEIHNGIDIAPTITEAPIIQETVGPITTKYSDKWSLFSTLKMTKVNLFLKPLYKKTTGLFLRV